jgi:hypothetical protein
MGYMRKSGNGSKWDTRQGRDLSSSPPCPFASISHWPYCPPNSLFSSLNPFSLYFLPIPMSFSSLSPFFSFWRQFLNPNFSLFHRAVNPPSFIGAMPDGSSEFLWGFASMGRMERRMRMRRKHGI